MCKILSAYVRTYLMQCELLLLSLGEGQYSTLELRSLVIL